MIKWEIIMTKNIATLILVALVCSCTGAGVSQGFRPTTTGGYESSVEYKLDSEEPADLLLQAHNLMWNGQYIKAIRIYETVYRSNSQNKYLEEALFSMANCLSYQMNQQKDFAKALEYLDILQTRFTISVFRERAAELRQSITTRMEIKKNE